MNNGRQFNLESPSEWATILWMYFTPLIRSGNPFYLAVDERLLNFLVGTPAENILEFRHNVEVFHKSCLKLLSFEYGQAIVRQSSYDVIPKQIFSPMICLAVQQVLVVEGMLKDDEHSENAYFPRYRRILEKTAGNIYSNPLLTSDFQRIWEHVKKEIECISGKSDIITFSAGLGRDLNRQLPISQALFTTQDLLKLKDRVSPNVQLEELEAIRQFLFRFRNILGARGRKLISMSGHRKIERLCLQLKCFLERPITLDLIEEGSNSRKVREKIVGFLDKKQFSEDYFSFRLWDGDENYSGGKELFQIIATRLESIDFLIFVSDTNKYVEISSDSLSVEGNTILLIAHKSRQGEIWQKVERALPNVFSENESLVFSNLEENFVVFAIDNVSYLEAESAFGLIMQKSVIELVGGIQVDRRSRIYLNQYPPKWVYRNGVAVPNDYLITVPVIGEISISDFFSKLVEDKRVGNYFVSIDEFEISFSLTESNLLAEESFEFGFEFEDNTLSPSSSSMEGVALGLSGIRLSTRKAAFTGEKNVTTSIALLANLLDPDLDRIAMCKEDIDKVLNVIGGFEIPPAMKNFIVIRIRKTGTIPYSPLIREILLNDFIGP